MKKGIMPHTPEKQQNASAMVWSETTAPKLIFSRRVSKITHFSIPI
jgi:hypothetical protein